MGYTFEIDEAQFKTWMRALRSGKYKQTTDTLQDSVGYCCLGVACKVLIPEGELIRDCSGFLEGGMPEAQHGSPSWLIGLSDDLEDKLRKEGNHYHYHHSESIAGMNDYKEMSFDEIADVLEAVYIHKVLD